MRSCPITITWSRIMMTIDGCPLVVWCPSDARCRRTHPRGARRTGLRTPIASSPRTRGPAAAGSLCHTRLNRKSS
jgi:hypothetical protein